MDDTQFEELRTLLASTNAGLAAIATELAMHNGGDREYTVDQGGTRFDMSSSNIEEGRQRYTPWRDGD
jgi:hypothetical protein